MARALRLDDPGTWHHVMHRGGSRRTVFATDDHRRRFLALLARAVDRDGIRLHAYCLMGNHYHLLIEDCDGRLSLAMRLVNQVYAQWVNHHHAEDGPLFRGRFHSRAVQDERYALACLRYIHNNPVAAGMCRCPEAYVWSSHRAYLSATPSPWLHTQTCLSAFGSEPDAARAALHRFVTHSQRPADDAGRLMGPAWGDDAWLANLRHKLRQRPDCMGIEVPQGRRLGGRTIAEVSQLVARAYGIEARELCRSGRGQHREAREVAMHLLLRFSALSHHEVGAAFGLKGTSIPWSARRPDGPLAERAGSLALALGLCSQAAG